MIEPENEYNEPKNSLKHNIGYYVVDVLERANTFVVHMNRYHFRKCIFNSIDDFKMLLLC